jgi:hypothetical protein
MPDIKSLLFFSSFPPLPAFAPIYPLLSPLVVVIPLLLTFLSTP